MRSNGNGAIDSVLRTTDLDHASDRILRAQFWLPRSMHAAPGAPEKVGEVISLAAFRARRLERATSR